MNKYVGQKYKIINDLNGELKKGDIVTLFRIEDDKISIYKRDNGNIYYLYDIDNEDYGPEVELLEKDEDIVFILQELLKNKNEELEELRNELDKYKKATKELEEEFVLLTEDSIIITNKGVNTKVIHRGVEVQGLYEFEIKQKVDEIMTCDYKIFKL